MAKAMSKDSQIILNMMRIQDSMNDILDSTDTDNELVQDKSKIDLLTFYIIKMFSMRKNFSGKTKKALSMFDDFKGNAVMNSLVFCYPMICAMDIVKIARELSDEVARDEFKTRYEICIKESMAYDGE